MRLGKSEQTVVEPPPRISVKGWHRSMNNWSMFIENWEY